MLAILPELLIAPVLVALSTLAARRWGAGVGGLVSAFPAVVGPVLVIVAQQRGADFAARTAEGTLLGLVTLSVFAVAYARCAVGSGWQASLIIGWACSVVAAATIALFGHDVAFPAGLLAAALSLAAAHRGLPRPKKAAPPVPPSPPRGGDIPLRMAATATLIAVLTAAAEVLGPLIGGVLSALPVLASVLVAFTHQAQGAQASVTLLRGMLAGMPGFVAFCTMVAVLVVPDGAPAAFAVAAACAIVLQAAALGAKRLWFLARRPGPSRLFAGGHRQTGREIAGHLGHRPAARGSPCTPPAAAPRWGSGVTSLRGS